MGTINLGRTLSELRAAKGVTQEAVAAALAELAEYFGVSTDRLLRLQSASQGTDSLSSYILNDHLFSQTFRVK